MIDTSRPRKRAVHHASLIKEVLRMLLAGIVHGDLSELNILLGCAAAGQPGSVVIDLPQAVDVADNNHAQCMLLRDVGNLHAFFGRFAPELLGTNYVAEIWDLYGRGVLYRHRAYSK